MAYTKFEQTYVDAYLNNMYPDVEQEEQPQDTMLAAGPTAEPNGQVTVSGFQPQQVRTDVQPAFGVARPIPQNKAQEALGYIGELLTKAGVQLDKVGIEIPVLGRVSLKDLTVGESGKVLEDMALGFYPIEGAGGFISGTTRIKPDPALELLNIAPAATAIAKATGKAAIKGATKAVQATKNMPVGMSTQMVGEGVSELGFYSAAKQAVDSIQQPKGTGEQFLKQIEKTPGVKPEEIKWTGLDDFLKSKKSVTKAEVQEFLDKNRVEIKEVALSDSGLRKKFSVNSPEDQDFYDVIDKQGKVIFTGPEDEADYLIDRSLTKFSKYTLPGGENYREILITLPFKEPDMPKGYQVSKVEYDDGTSRYFAETPTTRSSAYKTEEEAQAELQRMTEGLKGFRENLESFKSQHFDQPNILAHLRVNDRVDADGKKVLFIEEVQSDWHQTGRKKGYAGDVTKETDEYKALIKEWGDAPMEKIPASVRARLNELRPFVMKTDVVPNAPFKTTWHELAMKRAIQLAAEGGYDRVAFTTGKTQAERYDLSKQIANLRAEKITSGTKAGQYEISATDKNGKPAIYTVVPENELDGLIGKDLAKKIIDDSAQFPDGKDYSGLDLQVGGEGMKGFYDQILPKFLDKYAKKWDAKTGMTKIQTESKAQAMADANLLEELGTPRDKIDTSGMVSVQYIDVTPKMKESVLTKGQPLFAIGAGGAAVQQEDNQ